MNKTLIYGIGALAIVGVAYYLYNKPSTSPEAKSNFSGGDYSNVSGGRSGGSGNTLRTATCGGANGTQSNCPPCHRCLNGQCTALPPSVCRFTPSTR
jgi:hypothetical protein